MGKENIMIQCYDIGKIEKTGEWCLLKVHNDICYVVATFYNEARAMEFGEFMKRDMQYENTSPTV